MFLLHLVLAGVFICVLGSNYDTYYSEDVQSGEKPIQQKSKIKHNQSLNERNKYDAFGDWIEKPRYKHKKFPSEQPGTRLKHTLRRTTTEENWPLNEETTIPIIPTHTTPVTLVSWPSDLKRAVDKLVMSVANLNEVVQEIKSKNPPNVLKFTRKRMSKRDVSDVTTNITAESRQNDTKNASASDGGLESNDDFASVPQFQNGRRSGSNFNSVKQKLLMYLDEGFQDIGVKVNSLRKIKQQFANVAPYKIGYIVANVDTLAVSIKNLREESKRNRQLWEEREILEVYDRLKISNSLITNLMETLRLLVEDN